MVTFAVIEFGLLIVALVFSYAHVRWLKSRRARITVTDELKTMFNHEWNGTDADELYAWYRVRYKVMSLTDTHRSRTRKLEEIERYIGRLSTRPVKGRACVSNKGELLNAEHIRETGLF